MQYVVLFRHARQMHIEGLVIGPFKSDYEAYEALIKMPSPGIGGHKYIQELSTAADIPDWVKTATA